MPARSHSPRRTASKPAELPTVSSFDVTPCCCSCESRKSRPTQWLPIDDQIGDRQSAADQADFDLLARFDDFGVSADRDKAVGPAEGRHGAGAFAHREGDQLPLLQFRGGAGVGAIEPN